MDDAQAIEWQPSDESLAARVVAGDVGAFATLYDRYSRPVYSLAAHSLGDAEAEEVVQEVFLVLWNRAGQFDVTRGFFHAWFLSIARHYVLARLRERGQQQRLVIAGEIDSLLAAAVDPSPDVEELAWQRERGKAVLHALKSLPPDQRKVLVLAYFGGLSQSTLADQLGWPLGTVKKRIRLGLQKLRSLLGDEEAPPHGTTESSKIGAE